MQCGFGYLCHIPMTTCDQGWLLETSQQLTLTTIDEQRRTCSRKLERSNASYKVVDEGESERCGDRGRAVKCVQDCGRYFVRQSGNSRTAFPTLPAKSERMAVPSSALPITDGQSQTRKREQPIIHQITTVKIYSASDAVSFPRSAATLLIDRCILLLDP